MKRSIFYKGFWRVWVPGGSLFLLGGCGLSDAQLTSILQSALTTGLSALLTQIVSALFGAGAGTA